MANGNQKPSASKTTKRVRANNFFSASSATKSTSGKSAKSSSGSGGTAKTVARAAGVAAVSAGVIKATKKIGAKTLFIALFCFVIALAIGAGACYFLGKDDKFDLLGDEFVSLATGEKYTDEGVDIREFGLDFSKNAVISTDLEKDEDGNYYADSVGDYYIAYTVKSLKFGLIYPVQKIRLISVTGESEGGE